MFVGDMRYSSFLVGVVGSGDMQYEAFMVPFDFTLDDLIQNRHHLISQRQIQRLRRKQLQVSILFAVLALMAGGLAVTSLREPRNMLTLVVTASLSVFAAYMGLTRWMRISIDIREKKVSVTRGKVRIGAGSTRNIGYEGDGRRLKINGMEFIIPFEGGAVLSENVNYSIYFVPHSKVVLAVERERH